MMNKEYFTLSSKEPQINLSAGERRKYRWW